MRFLMKDERNSKRQILIFAAVCLVLLLVFNAVLLPMMKSAQVKETNYSYFLKKVDEGSVISAEIDQNKILFEVEKEDGSTQVYSRQHRTVAILGKK